MIRFIILFCVLSINTAYASENIHFLDKPKYLTSTEAMIAIAHAAKNRQYIVQGKVGDTLRITLIHKGYNVDLVFSVSGNEITYKDSTTYADFNTDDTDTQAKTKSVPAGWIKGLRNNAENFFLLIKNIKDNMKVNPQEKSSQ